MQIRVLGHLEATVDDRPVALGGAKQRAVLAMLGLEANRPVTADRLIEGLWAEDPPPSAAKMVQNYVLRLRKSLADDATGTEIVTRGRAYELQIDRELVDACRLERLVAEASRAAEAGQANGAAREALALFRGEPLSDVAHEPFAGAEIRRLEELRLTAAELAIDADLAAGHDQEIVAEVDALLTEHPLRERLHAQRMLALYRSGRQAEALEAYREARRTLVEEVGIEPTPELRELHDAILRQDPDLLVAKARPELPPELDASAASPLIGREDELNRLQVRWRRGTGIVTVAGGYGMGKTRLAAELAGQAHREGATVAYAAGIGSPEAALAVIGRLRSVGGSGLLVLDDADRASAAVRVAARDLACFVLATGQEAAALQRLEPVESLTLGPLDALGVRAIAGFYAPAGGDVPVDTLLAASRGIPRGVHEAASEWARREATRRVDEAAGRAVGGRTQARALETALADSVADLQSTHERARPEAVSGPLVCPYKGLATFGVDDAAYFFGRERLVAELVAHVVGAPLLAVVGPSGSGKSSVVRAGLLPALAGGVLPGSQAWAQAIVRPGAHPLRELRRATHKLEREWRSVLVVDQFEELFTACPDEAERAGFVSALVRWALDREGGAVVIAVRADFYGRCAAYPDLSALLGANHVLVGPMSRDELARAIERPAQRTGLSVEPELVEALLGDVEGRPGALPLLSTALLELWRERDGRHLRLAAYARSGGVQGAVARLAETAYVALAPEQQAAARALFLRLTDEDEGGARVRRRVELADVDADVAGRLADRRLLTIDDGTVEVAHEALLREWPRLHGWLDEDVQGRRLHRRLAAAARAWQTGDGDVYRGAPLAAALEWAAAHDDELNAAERDFLAASRRAGTRAQRRLRAVLAGVASLLVLAVIAGVVALQQRSDARDQATVAAAQALGAHALAEGDLAKSLLLARQGMALDDSPQTRSNLLATLLKNPAAVGVLPQASKPPGQTEAGAPENLPPLGLALSPDGRTLVSVGADGNVRFVSTATRHDVAHLLLPGPQTTEGVVAFSPDGTRLVVGGTQLAVVDARTHRILAQPLVLDGQVAEDVAFSPDGRVVFALLARFDSSRATLMRFDARTGAKIGLPPVVGGGALMAVAGGRVVTSREGGPTIVRDGRSPRPLRRFAIGSGRPALSADGRTVLLGGHDGSVRFLDLESGQVRTGSGHHDGAVTRMTFSADGRTAVTGGEEGRVIVWDVSRAAPRETLTGHTAVITGLELSPDGRTLYTSGVDGETLIWDLGGAKRLGRPFANGGPQQTRLGPYQTSALDSSGRLLAVGHTDGTVTVIDARTLRQLTTFRAVPSGPVFSLAFVPRGGPLVVGGAKGFLALVDSRRGAVLQRLRGQFGDEIRVSLSADGRRMVTLSGQDSIALWTLRDGRVAGRPRRSYPTYFPVDLLLSADGRTLTLVSSGGVEIADAVTLHRQAMRPSGGALWTIAGHTPDGRYLIATGQDGWAQLWSATTLRPVTRKLSGHTGQVPWASVSADGRTLAAGGVDGTIRLYDLPSQQPLGAPLPTAPDSAVAPLFSPDGTYLFALTDSGSSYRWDVRPASWARHACAVAGRILTPAEWDEALPGRPYAPACR